MVFVGDGSGTITGIRLVRIHSKYDDDRASALEEGVDG
jgi:hypothetical protein